MLRLVKIALLSLALLSSYSYADCIHNGNVYAEGAVIGTYVCAGGRWVKRR